MGRKGGTYLVWCLFLIIVLGALGLRTYRIDSGPLTDEEVFSASLTNYPAGEIVSRIEAHVHPPLYYLVLKAWRSVGGSSPTAMRVLSVFFGVLSVPMAFLLCLEAQRRTSSKDNYPYATYGGALFCAALLAVHFRHVEYAHSVRMYSLAIFVAALSSWLLLRALRAEKQFAWWWAVYGLTIAAFCYVHNYGLFTALGQAVFVVGDLLWRIRKAPSRMLKWHAAGSIGALVLALAVYSPWVPVLWTQAHSTDNGFWSGQFSWLDAGYRLQRSTTGVEHVSETWVYVVALLVELLIIYTLVRPTRATIFFLVQAAVPWLLSIGISYFGSGSIFREQYLVCAQISVYGLFGATLAGLPRWPERCVFAALLLFTTGHGMLSYVGRIPNHPPAVGRAALLLKERYEPGDVIVVPDVVENHRLANYLRKAGLQRADIRSLNPARAGGFSTALDPGIFVNASELPADAIRLWYVRRTETVDPRLGDMEELWSYLFKTANGEEQYYLHLYVHPTQG